MLTAIGKLLLKAGWAPLAVVVLHASVAKTPFRKPMDFPIHYLGGAAIAYSFSTRSAALRLFWACRRWLDGCFIPLL
jgi:hypothetical protein